MKVSANLRTELPEYDTAELAVEWDAARRILRSVDALEVPCCMNLETRRMLFQTIRAMGAKSVLDIGTYVGLSALNYALAVGEGGHVTTVDIADANAAEGYWAKTRRPCSPRAMMDAAGVSDIVEFITRDSVAYLENETIRFDFISIDGWHEAAQVYQELELVMDRLNPGGLIFMDDVMQFNDPHRPAGLDYIEGPYRALLSHLNNYAPLDVVYNSRTFSEWTATAFLLRRADE